MTDDGAVISTPPYSTDAAAVAAAFGVLPADGLTDDEAARRLVAAGAKPLGARVRRGGEARDLPAAELVPGDVVLLRTGDVVPADLRLLETDALLVNRSALTGESLPEAGAGPPGSAGSPLAGRAS